MSQTLLMVVGAAVLVGVTWIVQRAVRSGVNRGDAGGTFYVDGTSSNSGNDCADTGGNSGGCDGDGDGGGGGD